MEDDRIDPPPTRLLSCLQDETKRAGVRAPRLHSLYEFFGDYFFAIAACAAARRAIGTRNGEQLT